MSRAADEETAKVREFMEGGAELAGAVVGGAVGLLGGPAGALGGGASGVAATRVLRRVGSELRDRYLGPRQSVRAGAAFAFAVNRISARLMAGARPRSDGFFESGPLNGRSAAEELLEGVLLHAADSYEERKVPLLGNFYAELAFTSSVDRPTANFLLLLTRRLTYRQLVVMACLWEREATTEALEGSDRVGFDDALSIEVDELERFGLVGRDDPGGTPKRLGVGSLDAGSLDPRNLTLTGPGAVLYDLMDLATIGTAARDDALYSVVVKR